MASRYRHPVILNPKTRNRRWKRLGRFLLAVLLLGIGVAAYANLAPSWVARGRLYDDPAKVPLTRVALVFGTTDRVEGGENRYFRYRIDATEQLWKAGRIQVVIVSGDNSTKYYNEPAKMRQALIERGIPADRIVSDFAGLRTLDSVVRAKEVFGLDSVVFVSQQFQNERALYLARANGLDACGFNARDVTSRMGLKTRVREIGARVLMWLDVHVLGTRPQYLGERITLPE
ncbi:MAG: YdcF family protein [Akkermansiaceae bacterium]|nr:YdcF family protein [Akkermansiaceae bacterium]MCF7732700.1 YdcF family protein [Akkermansiaceae bacterium]